MMRHYHLLIALSMTLLPVATAPAATIDLPQTGQTLCYAENGIERPCAGTGEDGEYQAGVAWPNTRFTVDASGQCITDNLTGLMWTQNANAPGRLTWKDALGYANNLVLCGYDDWRLPNRKEMFSLMTNVTATDVGAWLTAQGFTNVDASYWTSTTVSGTQYAWFVISNFGSVERSDKAFPDCAVWPVRGGR